MRGRGLTAGVQALLAAARTDRAVFAFRALAEVVMSMLNLMAGPPAVHLAPCMQTPFEMWKYSQNTSKARVEVQGIPIARPTPPPRSLHADGSNHAQSYLRP